MTNLFLDDIRNPADAHPYTGQTMFLDREWVVVRNYDEFTAWIETNGLPGLISFDHDLAFSHYTPEPLWTDYEASRAWQDAQTHQEKTGYECALWLVDYCLNTGNVCPDFYCHSMNPVGKDKIVGVLTQFKQRS